MRLLVLVISGRPGEIMSYYQFLLSVPHLVYLGRAVALQALGAGAGQGVGVGALQALGQQGGLAGVAPLAQRPARAAPAAPEQVVAQVGDQQAASAAPGGRGATLARQAGAVRAAGLLLLAGLTGGRRQEGYIGR